MTPLLTGTCWRCMKENKRYVFHVRKYNWAFCDRPCGAILLVEEKK